MIQSYMQHLVFQVFTGVRQGSVLSPVLFSIYIDGISKLHDPNNGAYVILYADDILLMSHSTSTLQILLTTCENELDMHDRHGYKY